MRHIHHLGKLLGAAAGVVLLPSAITAVVGMALGGAFDYFAQKDRARRVDDDVYQNLCLDYLALAAALAGVGRAPHHAWAALRPQLTGLAVDMHLAERFFQKALGQPSNLDALAETLYKRVGGQPQQLSMLLAGLYAMAQRQGHSPTQRRILENMAAYFGVDTPLDESPTGPDEAHPDSPDPHQDEDKSAPHPHKSDALAGQNPYVVLGVSAQATTVMIKSAYRKLVAKHHPDRLRGQGANAKTIQAAEEKMRIYNAAYDRLVKHQKG